MKGLNERKAHQDLEETLLLLQAATEVMAVMCVYAFNGVCWERCPAQKLCPRAPELPKVNSLHAPLPQSPEADRPK